MPIGLGLGIGPTFGASVAASTGYLPSPITSVTWISSAADTTPDFTIVFDGSETAGDVLVAQYSADGAGIWVAYFSHTLTVDDIIAGTITIDAVTPLAEGNWDFRFRTERGGTVSAWTASVDVTINLAPTISSFNPADGATGVAVTDNLIATFNKPVQFGGSGVIELYDSDNDLIESFNVVTEVGTSAGQVSISGADLTINPTASMEANKGHYVKIGATAIENLNDIPFAGIANTTTWNFTSVASGAPVPGTVAGSPFIRTSSLASGSSHTFAATPIGTAHADRVVVVIEAASQQLDTPTLGGITMTPVDAPGTSLTVRSYQLATGAGALAAATTADLVFANNSGGTAGQVVAGVFVCYPASPTRIDGDGNTLGSTSDVTLTGIDTQTGGFICGASASVGAATVTQTGPDAVTEHYDAIPDVGFVNIGLFSWVSTEGPTSRNITLHSATSGTKRLIISSYGAPA